MTTVTGKEKKSSKGRRRTKAKGSHPSKANRSFSPNGMSPRTDGNYQKTSKWEAAREKQQLVKKLGDLKEKLEKDKKKVKSDRLALEKKRRGHLNQKTTNDRLTIQLEMEKELWLERKKKKGHKFNKAFLLKKVAGKIKEWETKGDQAKQEWINIERDRAEMKELDSGLERDQAQLISDRARLEAEKTEFEVKSKDLDGLCQENEVEKARLKVLEDELLEGERKVDEHIQRYDAYDLKIRNREIAASQKEAEQKTERERLENIKQDLLDTSEKKAGFNQNAINLFEQIAKMDGSFAELFSDVVGKVENPDVGKVENPDKVTPRGVTNAGMTVL